jgi:hypothetical protein
MAVALRGPSRQGDKSFEMDERSELGRMAIPGSLSSHRIWESVHVDGDFEVWRRGGMFEQNTNNRVEGMKYSA